MEKLPTATLYKATFEFSQEGNTDGTTDVYEDLTVECEGLDMHNGDCYYVLRTKSGWSIDGPQEIQQLLERVNKMIKL